MATKRTASASSEVDKQLARYRSMRDFHITAEPSGKSSAKTKKNPLPFVIQKHAASHLHYDFRLGWNGVLKSWAVAKGPSYVTADKRLAVQVEDHPMEYGGFEGIIPAGQYGGGTVMVWDQGTWAPQPGHEDVNEGLRKGSLKFTMSGTKMHGKWTLIRMGGKAASERKPNWLLIKEHDEYERTAKQPCITVEKPNSAITGRSLEEIAAHEDHVWNSKETANPNGSAWFKQKAKPAAKAAKASKSAAKKSARPALAEKKTLKFAPDLKSAPKESLPAFIDPQLALQATQPPSATGWLHELKLDGYRIQARKDGARVQLLTRKGLDWTHRMKPLAAAIAALPASSAILDGEVVVLGENGTTNFADLQAAFQEGVRKPLSYFVFDLLHLNGHNLRKLALKQRKQILADLLTSAPENIRLSEHLETDGEAMFHKACELHAEGIISKRADAAYCPGRSADWLKSKCIREQELVIGGFTLPSNGTRGIGALLLGYYKDGKLTYAGRTGTGFTQKTHRIMRDKLDALRTDKSAFGHALPADARRGVIFVKPKLVAQVNFATWTADNLVRQASFKGLREDKPAIEVVREEATVAPKPRGHARHTVAPAINPPKKTRMPKATAKPATKIASKSAAKSAPTPTSKATLDAPPSGDHAPVRLTHPEKVLDAESGLTKQQLADYFWAVAPHMLPHVADRPLSLVRCPEGSGKPCFFQKHVNHMLPPGIGGVVVINPKTKAKEDYITLSTQPALAGLAQMGVMEVHPWGSKNNSQEKPDRITIDLDPDPSVPWSEVTSAAALVRAKLKKLGLETFLKSTGGKGLHVVIPIKPEHEWPIVKQFAHAFVLEMEKEAPTRFLTKMSKAARKDRIFLDYLRNERGATAVAAFSPRARPGATVSLPLNWTDLKLPQRPEFRVADFAHWKSRLARDPWKKMADVKQSLTPAVMKLTERAA